MERMDYRHEEFQFEEGSRIQVFDVAKKQETLHCHDCLELNRIESGTGNYIIGGKVYEICPGIFLSSITGKGIWPCIRNLSA